MTEINELLCKIEIYNINNLELCHFSDRLRFILSTHTNTFIQVSNQLFVYDFNSFLPALEVGHLQSSLCLYHQQHLDFLVIVPRIQH